MLEKHNLSSTHGDPTVANELRQQTRNRFTRASDQRGDVCMGKADVDQPTLGGLNSMIRN